MDLLKEAQEAIKAKLSALMKAIIIVGSVAIPALFGLFKLVYDRHIETLEARIEGYKEELTRVQYPKESKALLQRQALELVHQIREFVEDVDQEEETAGVGQHIVTTATGVLFGFGGLPHEKALYYEKHFKVRAIVLRDRILRLLPPNEDRSIPDYNKLTLPAIRAVADDLERLARELDSVP